MLLALFHEGDDAPIGPGAAQKGQNGEHQQILKGIPLTLRPPRIRNIFQSGQKTSERNHGNLETNRVAV